MMMNGGGCPEQGPEHQRQLKTASSEEQLTRLLIVDRIVSFVRSRSGENVPLMVIGMLAFVKQGVAQGLIGPIVKDLVEAIPDLVVQKDRRGSNTCRVRVQMERREDVSAVVLPLADHLAALSIGGKGSDEEGVATSERFFTFGGDDTINSEAATLVVGEDIVDAASSMQHGLLGIRHDNGAPVFLNTNHPFCATLVGVQGSGKSHTVSAIIENCMLHVDRVTRATNPSATIVFHYDTDQSNFCQAATLTTQSPAFPSMPVINNLVVLVSPSFYMQRIKFYNNLKNCTVRPLLFKWSEMNAAILKSLMRIRVDKDPPLYMGALLDLLRKLQKRDEFPTFVSFKRQLEHLDLSSSQLSPLMQRIRLVESLLEESDENAFLADKCDMNSLFKSGTVVICDLTDPMMTASEARGVFEVLLERFRHHPLSCGKLVVFDEAHKYLKSSSDGDDLCETIVDLVRQMRHHGMRIVVSSQSPMTFPDELLELSSLCVMHSFHSRDWFHRLQCKLPLSNDLFDRIMSLPSGRAIVFSGKWSQQIGQIIPGVNEIRIRPRITADAGKSKLSVMK